MYTMKNDRARRHDKHSCQTITLKVLLIFQKYVLILSLFFHIIIKNYWEISLLTATQIKN